MDAKSKCHSPSLVNFVKMRNFFQNDYSTKKNEKGNFPLLSLTHKNKNKTNHSIFRDFSSPFFSSILQRENNSNNGTGRRDL